MSVATQKNSEPRALYPARLFAAGQYGKTCPSRAAPRAVRLFAVPATRCDTGQTRATTGLSWFSMRCVGHFFLSRASFEEITNSIAGTGLHRACAAIGATEEQRLQQSVANLVQSAQGKSHSRGATADRPRPQAGDGRAGRLAVQGRAVVPRGCRQTQTGTVGARPAVEDERGAEAIEELRSSTATACCFPCPRATNPYPCATCSNRWRNSRTRFRTGIRLETTLKFLQALKRDQALARLAANASASQGAADAASLPRDAGECLSKQENVSKGVDGLLSEINKNTQQSDSALFSKKQLPRSTSCVASKIHAIETGEQGAAFKRRHERHGRVPFLSCGESFRYAK